MSLQYRDSLLDRKLELGCESQASTLPKHSCCVMGIQRVGNKTVVMRSEDHKLQPPGESGRMHLDSPDRGRQKIAVVGGALHYRTAGQGGKTLVLLHKLGGWSREWRWIMPALARRARVIAVDLAGHGDSAMHGEPPYIVTQEEIAIQLMALLSDIGEQNVTLIGSSLGGCVALVCGAFWPDRVDALITVGSAIASSRSRASLSESDQRYIKDGMFDAYDNPLPRDPAYMTPTFGMTDRVHMEDMVRSREAAGR